MTPLCVACNLAEVAVALLNGGANIDFVTPLRRSESRTMVGVTSLMCAVAGNHTGVLKILLKRGADGTKQDSHTATAAERGAGSTALDIFRSRAIDNPDCAATLAVLRKRCCSTPRGAA